MKVVKLLAVMVVGALLYQGARVVLESRSLRLEKFEVEGNTESRVSTKQVIRASGVNVGDQLIRISTEKVSDRLERLPWVAKARVERILPSTLRIDIEERKASLVVATGQGPYLVDSGGLVLQQGSEKLVNLLDLPLETVRPGSRISTPEFSHAARIMRSLPPQIRERVSLVRAPSIDQIQIETAGGPVIFYGAAEQIAEKNFAAHALFQRSGDGSPNAGVIDVRVPSRPAVRPR